MRKFFVILIVITIIFACIGCGKEEQKPVPEQMSEETFAIFQKEYQPGDIAIYSVHGELFVDFVRNPTEEKLQEYVSSVTLLRFDEGEEFPIERIRISNDGLSRHREKGDSVIIAYNGCDTFLASTNTLQLAKDPQTLQVYLGQNGYNCTVESAYLVTCADYYNVIWVKGSDVSYFIRIKDEVPHSIYTPEKLLSVLQAEF